MPIDYQRLKSRVFPERTFVCSARDAILYALGVGLGSDPCDRRQLRYVYEQDLQVLPSYAVILGFPGNWLRDPDTGVDYSRVVHAGHEIVLHGALPAAGSLTARTRVLEVIDKGPGKGALVEAGGEVYDRDSGAPLCAWSQTTLCRADGGFGGPAGPVRAVHSIPDRPADVICDLPTLPQAGLIYRLSGDMNPLHADPQIARAAGFERPILQGLCTFGVAAHALLRELCHYEAERIRKIGARFSAPVFPGDTIRTAIWREGNGKAAFRCSAVERAVTVIDNGYTEFLG